MNDLKVKPLGVLKPSGADNDNMAESARYYGAAEVVETTDPTARLVFADYLEENGRPDYAGYQRSIGAKLARWWRVKQTAVAFARAITRTDSARWSLVETAKFMLQPGREGYVTDTKVLLTIDDDRERRRMLAVLDGHESKGGRVLSLNHHEQILRMTQIRVLDGKTVAVGLGTAAYRWQDADGRSAIVRAGFVVGGGWRWFDANYVRLLGTVYPTGSLHIDKQGHRAAAVLVGGEVVAAVMPLLVE